MSLFKPSIILVADHFGSEARNRASTLLIMWSFYPQNPDVVIDVILLAVWILEVLSFIIMFLTKCGN